MSNFLSDHTDFFFSVKKDIKTVIHKQQSSNIRDSTFGEKKRTLRLG